MQRTSIEWTNWSCTPLKMRMPDGTLVNACAKISPGCAACYAENYVRRFWRKAWGKFPGYTKALLKIGKPFLIEEELQAVIRLNDRIGAGKADPALNRVFWNDMTDEFLEFWPDEFRDKLFAVRAITTNLIHQVLTKRGAQMLAYFRMIDEEKDMQRWANAACDLTKSPCAAGIFDELDYPLSNVHLGHSVEDQQRADERIPLLLQTPAAVRFLSCEPLLSDIDLTPWIGSLVDAPEETSIPPDPIHWCIVGGESGRGARPCSIAWVRSIVEQCKGAGVACFVKQLGSKPQAEYTEATGAVFKPQFEPELLPLKLKHSKGGDPAEWPADLRVRQMPETAVRA